MDTNNSYGAKARVTRKGPAPRRETTQSTKRSITIPREEVAFYGQLANYILRDVRNQHISFLERENIPFDERKLLKEYVRDAVEIQRRLAHEGLGFLTKTLPALAKAVDTALAKSVPCCIVGFEQDDDTGLPRFLGGLLRMILTPRAPKNGDPVVDIDHDRFETEAVDNETIDVGDFAVLDYSRPGDEPACEDCRSIPGPHIFSNEDWETQVYGTPHAEKFGQPIWTRRAMSTFNRSFTTHRYHCSVAHPAQTAVALKLIRQVCYAFYKVELPYDEKEQNKVLEDFVEVDSALPEEIRIQGHRHHDVLKMARSLINCVLANADPLEIHPRHGKGAVATGEKPHQKAAFKRFYTRLNEFYPYDQFFFYNHSHLADRLQELETWETLEAGTAKVVLVPKDSRGPRLISCEPLEYQWIQQGQMDLLYKTIETHPLTRGRVNFKLQGVNRHLALLSSRNNCEWNQIVTLDMKEASDRVSLALVKALFPKRWFEALYASRSSQTRLPTGHLHTFKKFAPMGSAVCFPVEALIFWALGVAVTSTEAGFSWKTVVRLLSDRIPLIGKNVVYSYYNPQLWHVYGDDIICAGQFAPQYRNVLESVGLKLNDAKCCVDGFFRESCGCDAYAGIDVTPTKIRRRWLNRYDPNSVLSWVAYSNALYAAGYLQSAQLIEQTVQTVCSIPYVSWESANIGYLAFRRAWPLDEVKKANLCFKTRFNRELQRREILAPVPTSPKIAGNHDGWEEMLLAQSLRRTDMVDPEADNLSDPSPKWAKSGLYAVRRRVKLKLRWMAYP